MKRRNYFLGFLGVITSLINLVISSKIKLSIIGPFIQIDSPSLDNASFHTFQFQRKWVQLLICKQINIHNRCVCMFMTFFNKFDCAINLYSVQKQLRNYVFWHTRRVVFLLYSLGQLWNIRMRMQTPPDLASSTFVCGRQGLALLKRWQCKYDYTLLKTVWFDQSKFINNGIMNQHNSHSWN